MAWTAPRTWVTSEVVTASHMNTHVRDNLLETGPAIVTAGDKILVSDAANSLVEREVTANEVGAAETTTSGSYTNLTTSGPSVTVTTGTTALVVLTTRVSNSSAGQSCFMGFDISGASTVAASDGRALQAANGADYQLRVSAMYAQTGLTAGSNVFKAEYRVSAGTGSFASRYITVLPF